MGALTSAASNRHTAGGSPASRGAAREAAKQRRSKAHRPARAAADIFAIPDHLPPSVAALSAQSAGDVGRVPVGVALALAAFAVLSATFVIGAARKVEA